MACFAWAWTGGRFPATVFNVEASRQMGAFIGINGVASDHTFALKLAYSYGVAFFTEIVGRYRSGPHQIFHFPILRKQRRGSTLRFERQGSFGRSLLR